MEKQNVVYMHAYIQQMITQLLKKRMKLWLVTTQMNPDNIMLSGVSQAQKDKECRIPI